MLGGRIQGFKGIPDRHSRPRSQGETTNRMKTELSRRLQDSHFVVRDHIQTGCTPGIRGNRGETHRAVSVRFNSPEREKNHSINQSISESEKYQLIG